MKYVSETNAGKSISAFIVLDKTGKQVAKIQVFYGSTVLVNVWAQQLDGLWGNIQIGRAGGYGYDKFTAALSGMEIMGIKLNDHCGQDNKTKAILKNYIKAVKEGKPTEKYMLQAKKIGAHFANYSTYFKVDGKYIENYNFEGDKETTEKTMFYNSLYYSSGLDRLRDLGFTVLQAI